MLSIHFYSFNYEYIIVKEARDANLLSQESKLTRVNLQLNFASFKIDHPSLKTDTYSISLITTTHYKLVRLWYAITIISLTFLGFVK